MGWNTTFSTSNSWGEGLHIASPKSSSPSCSRGASFAASFAGTLVRLRHDETGLEDGALDRELLETHDAPYYVFTNGAQALLPDEKPHTQPVVSDPQAASR